MYLSLRTNAKGKKRRQRVDSPSEEKLNEKAFVCFSQLNAVQKWILEEPQAEHHPEESNFFLGRTSLEKNSVDTSQYLS